MSRVRTFAGLSRKRRLLFLQSVFLLWVTTLGFRLRGFRWTERTVGSWLSRLPTASRATTGDVRWAVRIGSRYVPSTACLERAVVANGLCVRHGHDTDLRIGVDVRDDEFRAHSWVVCDADVVVGDEVDLSQYEPLGRSFDP